MSKNNGLKFVGIAIVIIFAAGALLWARSAKHSSPALPKSGDIYWMGPMVNKGNPNVYGNEDGSLAKTPAEAKTAPASTAPITKGIPTGAK